METQGYWNLFWATGLPEAWLSTRTDPGEKQEEKQEENETMCPSPCPPPREL